MSPRRTLTQALRALTQPAEASALARRVGYVIRVAVQVVRQWARDHCPQQAASLAFQTALSIVPVLAVTLALLRATGEFDVQSSLVDFLAREVLPVSREEIAARLLEWAGKTSLEAAGVFGVVTTLVLAFVMYATLEDIFNDIWRVDRRRSYGQRFMVFYAVATLTPAFLGVSMYHAARLGFTTGLSGWIIELGASFVALFVANKLLPACRVRWSAAALGALLSALLFEVAKYLFRLYVVKVAFARYAGVYGTLGLVPVVLVWFYVSWLVVLLGAEVAHTLQNLNRLEEQERPTDERRIGPEPAARLLLAIVQKWRDGGGASTRAELIARTGLPEDAVERNLHYLREGGLVVEVEGDASGYLPARPPNEIRLSDVFALFRQTGAPDDRLKAALAEVDEKARAVSFDDLVR